MGTAPARTRLSAVHRTQEVHQGVIGDLDAVLPPCSTSSRTCQPTRIRDSPFSFDASDRLENRRRVGEAASQVPVSSVRLHALNSISSVPMTLAMTVAATAPSMECPESYDGVAPVGISGSRWDRRRQRVAVVRATESDRGLRPPPVVERVLAVPVADVAVGHAHVHQGEHPRLLPQVEALLAATVTAIRFHIAGELSNQK